MSYFIDRKGDIARSIAGSEAFMMVQARVN